MRCASVHGSRVGRLSQSLTLVDVSTIGRGMCFWAFGRGPWRRGYAPRWERDVAEQAIRPIKKRAAPGTEDATGAAAIGGSSQGSSAKTLDQSRSIHPQSRLRVTRATVNVRFIAGDVSAAIAWRCHPSGRVVLEKQGRTGFPQCPPDPTPFRTRRAPSSRRVASPCSSERGTLSLPLTGGDRNGRKGTTRLERGALVLGALWFDDPRRDRRGAARRGGRALRRHLASMRCSALVRGCRLAHPAVPKDQVVFAALHDAGTRIFGLHVGHANGSYYVPGRQQVVASSK